ncbi:cell division cycle protein 20 homolog [Agrilus planipennis]|uniref:Cell division cycle protein 20 homolog n=1 Tax=Agrilus planipennis TaxID=224129 RepID=A0A1W4WBD0_AGRPL|nr:cell division cycle protein 20 homolog [Agrilus planipennis]
MSQFKYLNEMNALLNIDGPLTNVPMPRWQKKKAQENNLSVISNGPLNSSKSVLSSSTNTTISTNKTTPNKLTGSDIVRTKKTPSKTPAKGKSPSRSKTPTPNKGAKTPGGGDRFIPTRSAINFDLGHFKINQDDSSADSPSKDLQKVMCENLHGTDISKQRILSYQVKAPAPPEGFQNPMRVVYTQTKTPASAKSNNRYIPQAPDRILDAPDIIDDYYLNLVDWNANNVLAVALESQIYLWDAGSGKIEQLLQLEGNDYVCSVSWIQEGNHLAVGTTKGTIELWDCNQMRRMRTMDGHSARVGSLAWNSYILTSGCRSGQIIHHDVRQREHNVLTVSGHTQEVCGLRWSTDGKYLASGGNDNVLNIWQAVNGGNHSQPTPVYTLTSHQAAVKALAWCPWQPNILASGGGTADRHIRFWNCSNGSCVNAIDTKSQVCALLWSPTYKELVSGHGFANNQIIIWKYPGMKKMTELTGHTARVLHLAMSPDGTTVLSAGADETLRLWKCFVKNSTKKETTGPVKAKASALKQSIR